MSSDVLSRESEARILEMVEQQLERRNPPNTKVLYRRAMYFIDPRVRELTVPQFNAKFPLRVKRRKARERAEAGGRRRSVHADGGNGAGGPGPEPEGGSPPGAGGHSGRAAPPERDADAPEPNADEEARRELRGIFVEYARTIATADGAAGLIDAYRTVGDYVDRALRTI